MSIKYLIRCGSMKLIGHGIVKRYIAVCAITLLTLYSVHVYLNKSVSDVSTKVAKADKSGFQTVPEIKSLERWWTSNITVNDFLETSSKSQDSIKVNMGSLRQVRNWNGINVSAVNGKPGIKSVVINMHDAPRDLYVNKKEIGITQIMNEHNFKGVTCNAKTPQFSKENNHHTALASFPRSGNTWTRHLLEKLSGILAGSVYKDNLAKHILKGSGHTENVVVIKTHKPYNKTESMNFDNAILLIRSPEESILSLFSYKHTHSHLNTVDLSAFNTSGKSSWKRHVPRSILRWKNFYNSWLQNYTRRIMILSYGKLQQDFFNEVFRVGHFLNLSMTFKTLWCVYKNQEGVFHRNQSGVVNKSTVYTDDMLQEIDAVRTDVAQRIKKMFGIEGII